MEAPDQRQDLCPNEAPFRLAVRGVDAERKPLGPAVRLGLLAPDDEKGPDDTVFATHPNAVHGPARDEPVEDGLDQVRACVPGRPRGCRSPCARSPCQRHVESGPPETKHVTSPPGSISLYRRTYSSTRPRRAS